MSSNQGPMERLFVGALLLAGAVLLVSWSIDTLSRLWPAILLVLAIIGTLVGGVMLAVHLFRNRSSRW